MSKSFLRCVKVAVSNATFLFVSTVYPVESTLVMNCCCDKKNEITNKSLQRDLPKQQKSIYPKYQISHQLRYPCSGNKS